MAPTAPTQTSEAGEDLRLAAQKTLSTLTPPTWLKIPDSFNGLKITHSPLEGASRPTGATSLLTRYANDSLTMGQAATSTKGAAFESFEYKFDKDGLTIQYKIKGDSKMREFKLAATNGELDMRPMGKEFQKHITATLNELKGEGKVQAKEPAPTPQASTATATSAITAKEQDTLKQLAAVGKQEQQIPLEDGKGKAVGPARITVEAKPDKSFEIVLKTEAMPVGVRYKVDERGGVSIIGKDKPEAVEPKELLELTAVLDNNGIAKYLKTLREKRKPTPQ